MSSVRIFKNKSFARFARKSGIADASLRKAVADAEKGLIDADLGGGVIKQRVARDGAGKSGGFRTLVLFRLGSRALCQSSRCKLPACLSAEFLDSTFNLQTLVKLRITLHFLI